jgi:hypothetical protein
MYRSRAGDTPNSISFDPGSSLKKNESAPERLFLIKPPGSRDVKTSNLNL